MISLEPKHIQWGWSLALAAMVLTSPEASSAAEFKSNNPLNAPAPIYWCPNRTPDQQIVTVPGPGCRSIYNAEKDTIGKNPDGSDRGVIKIHEIQNEASKFVQQYRKYLDCCATDVNSIDRIDELVEQANYILKSMQQKGIFNSTGMPSAQTSGGTLGTFSRQWTISEIVGTVSRARDDLRKLKDRLEHLGEAKDKLDALDHEAAGRERVRIEQEKESIAKEFRSRRPPESARTGMEIQDTTIPSRIGGDIEDTTLNKNFGADIGYTVSPYSDVREDLKPRRGTDIQDTTTPNRVGPNTQDTTLPYSFGFELEKKENPEGSSTTPSRVGPNIGDSSLNRRP